MNAPSVVKINVFVGVTLFARADAGVKVKPLPRPFARHQSQYVNVDVVETACRDDLCRLSKLLPVRACFARKVIIGGRVANLALYHGRVVVQVFPEVAHHLTAVFVVRFFIAREVAAQAAVIATSIANHIANVVSG